jgi:hypothetical protein
MPVYPINFSISSKKVIHHVRGKTRVLAPLIPGDPSTYNYYTEQEYYKMYQESCFALTTKKMGWDCMRHYEIMANGCLPVFLDIDQCPDTIMTMIPKKVLREIHDFYFDQINGKTEMAELTDVASLYISSYTTYLLEYMANHLTNRALAKYVLRMVGCAYRPNQRILFLSGCIHPDYLRCGILSGFKEIMGERCHDFPRIDHIYDDYPTPELCYGRGFSYSKLFKETDVRDGTLDASILDDIQRHVYDLVIYGSYHRGMPYWEEVNRHYAKHEIVMLCGEDSHTCNYKEYSDQGYHVFVRELMIG